MNKRKVSGSYIFKTAEVYPRWLLMCRDDISFNENNHVRMIRLDHRFMDGGEWKWITSDAAVTQWDRTEIARTLGALRSSILYLKHNSQSEPPQ